MPSGDLRSSGFASSPATSAQPEPPRALRNAGFGEASTSGPLTAVEIISKPRPIYSEEARTLRIEGEVVLQVLFAASGTTHVERILHSLGHGLDEAAAVSVADIRFRPAQRAGQPVDQVAIVHITFQLAY